MSERKKIEDRLRKKEQEILGLDDKIKTAKVYVQALKDILKMLDGGHDEAERESTLRAGSAVDLARQVILDRGMPVHMDELLGALGKEATREAKASLTSSLAAYVRRNEIFTRPAPNTFGLFELGHQTISDELPQPPENFGETRSVSEITDDDIPF
jgi:hypothetical protein